ncbi:DUF2975 domain-containing protein [Elizabethkingia anophelis]|uniref:DUF2975 domain-containing protein n=1 Tax=Elizabethkingia anophelis TaxID=1117645 RepID=UPI0004E32516|nr:DUF2975 domain-containing protein [Elizabethkingia anophelis]KFC36703.1 hypothetical protein FF18_01055 [Elizabethkingia anophelis]MCT3786736.1 DUF2975 domain-containing protein [Elizabethkingia anophelis]MCT3960739.1 DUF2975 domain-containing protein [Elizabethkingia anophelis]MDV3501076.1 DUF2975 domain-containing protein [Elizabethkingia anophelis]
MKIIGKNSLAKYLSYAFLVLFLFIAFHGIYEFIGFVITYINLKTNNNFLSETFYVGYSIDWGEKIITNPDHLFFRFKYPFSDQQMLTGNYTLGTFFNHAIVGIFWSIFLFYGYKISKALSKEDIFSKEIIRFLKTLYISIFVFVPLYIINWVIISKIPFSGSLFFSSFTYIFIAIIAAFNTEFFKKGYKLQSENDLTI